MIIATLFLLQELSVPEDTLPGTVVGQVEASDRDEGANGLVTYLLVGGNTFGCFGLNATTGHIYVVRPLDHEMNSTHVLTIRAIDSSGINPKSTLVRLTISVTDVNDCSPVFKEDPVSGNRIRKVYASFGYSQCSQNAFEWPRIGRYELGYSPVRSLAPLTHLLAPHRSLRSCASLHSLVC